MRTPSLLLTAALALNSCASDPAVNGPAMVADAETRNPDGTLVRGTSIDISTNTTIKPLDPFNPCTLIQNPVLQDIRDKSLFLLKRVEEELTQHEKNMKKASFACCEPEDMQGTRVMAGKKEVYVAKSEEEQTLQAGILVDNPDVSEVIYVDAREQPNYSEDCGGGGYSTAISHNWQLCSGGCTDHLAGGKKDAAIACGGEEAMASISAWGIGKEGTDSKIEHNEAVPADETKHLVTCVRVATRKLLDRFDVKKKP